MLPIVLPESDFPPLQFKHVGGPLWTGHKALLIRNYLYLFVLITKHGAYIDAFAGPQAPDDLETWSAKLVMESEPKRLTKFFFSEINKSGYKFLCDLRDSHINTKPKRKIDVHHGDCNRLLPSWLESRPIRDREASFCLLDQRTFECKWSTVETVANYKPKNENKIEIFYFLPNSWQDRALAALKVNKDFATHWWGKETSIEDLRKMGSAGRRDAMCERFSMELGYKYVTPWPIHKEEKGRGAVMYYMIHATDHKAAPYLMERAYHDIVVPKPLGTQQSFQFMAESEANSI